MPGTVRLVPDGEELVLPVGEAFRIRPGPVSRNPVTERAGEEAGSKRVAIQYLGFQDVQDRREYALRARRGNQEGRYTVSIKLVAFAKRQALLQDGPDICYQKLLHELAESELRGGCGILVTESDLAAYRESHAAPKRARSSPPRSGEPPKAQSAGVGGATTSPRRSNP
jgi:hypothetical protein